MTWTYSSTDLSTDLAKVRFRIGDTDTNDQLLTDEEIDAELDARSTVTGAAYACVQRILGKLARRTDRSAVGLSSSRSQASQHYRDLLVELHEELEQTAVGVLVGVSESEIDDLKSDSDFVQHSFEVGRDDMP